jgi:hypothetical protein
MLPVGLENSSLAKTSGQAPGNSFSSATNGVLSIVLKSLVGVVCKFVMLYATQLPKLDITILNLYKPRQ